MAKVDRNTIQAALNDANELEYELSRDEGFRDIDEYENWHDYNSEPYSLEDDYFDWRNDDIDYDLEVTDRYDDDLMSYHDYDSGDL